MGSMIVLEALVLAMNLLYHYVIIWPTETFRRTFLDVEDRVRRRLDGRTAIITGGARGIGREIAFELARRGVNLIIVDKNLKGLRDTIGELEAQHSAIVLKSCCTDLSNLESTNEALSTLRGHLKELGLHVDILVMNAVDDPHIDPTGEDVVDPLFLSRFVKQCTVNFQSHCLFYRDFIPDMILEGGGGHLVTISTVLSDLQIPQTTGYCVTKAALTALHRCVRLQ
ncbi:hypothetical protein ACOME3_005721 [Neoechinorhynchus agilis]